MSLYSVIASVLQGPTSPADLVESFEHRVRLRASGVAPFWLAVLNPPELDRADPLPFMVIVTTPETDADGRRYCSRNSDPILHLAANPQSNELGLFTATDADFREWFERVRRHLCRFAPHLAAAIDEYESAKRERAEVPPHSAPRVQLRLDALTLPNDLAVASIGYPNRERTQEAADSDAEASLLVERSYRQVRSIREALCDARQYPFGATELLLVTSGINRNLPKVIPPAIREPGDSLAHAVYRDVIRADGLLLPLSLLHPSAEWLADPRARSLIESRRGELDGTLLAAAVESSSQFIPTVPILGSLRSTRVPFRQMSDTLRLKPKKWRRVVSRQARDLGERMFEFVPEFVRRDLPALRGTVKVLSDDPIELLQVQQRPLSVFRPVVRVPVTPGFVLERLVQFADPIFLQPSDFASLLVLRGTLPSDPVFPWLEHFTRRVMTDSGMSLSIVDVRSLEEVVEALNGFSGPMVIVDAHGFHRAQETGQLVFGTASANILEAEHRFRVPPIVFLAACDTHAVDRGQETIALSFLTAGAKTVVGTLAPVGALESAVLCAELLMFIRQYVPICPGPVRWSELFWMVASAAHAAEGAFALRQERLLHLSAEDVQRVNLVAIEALARFQQDWLETVWEQLAHVGGTTREVVAGMWREVAYVTDSVLHCQLGHADRIFLTPSDTWSD